MVKPSFGVIVGRFQVHELHDGHMELFRIVRGSHNRVIVFIGVSPVGISRYNPLDFETRKRMIEAKFPEFSIHPIVDVGSDDLWSGILDRKIKELVQFGEVVLYGGRDSFVPHYTGDFKPKELEIESPVCGTDIRDKMTNTVMASSDFRAGIIYAANNMFPRVITCVDVVILRNDERNGLYSLMCKKQGELLYRYVGGHADPASFSFEDDVKREVMEETDLDIDSLEYIGSMLIDDWRWKHNPDKIKTLVFVGYTNTIGATAQDDIEVVNWLPVKTTNITHISRVHRPIFELFQNYLKKKEEMNGSNKMQPATSNG